VTEGDQLGGALGGHDAGQAGGAEDIALLHLAGQNQRQVAVA